MSAATADGVRGVFTGTDFVAQGVMPLPCTRAVDSSDGTPFFAPTRQVLAIETVRFVGDPVAMVVATSLEAAVDAAEQVGVDYVPLPALMEPASSDQVAVLRRIGDPDAVRAAFDAAAHVVRIERGNNLVWRALRGAWREPPPGRLPRTRWTRRRPGAAPRTTGERAFLRPADPTRRGSGPRAST